MKITKQQKIEALKESINHWKRMIRWAKKQNPLFAVDSGKMLDEINEVWGSRDCALCQLFFRNSCGGCPIFSIKYCCCEEYNSVENSKRWGKWLTNAGKMLKLLETKKAELEASLK